MDIAKSSGYVYSEYFRINWGWFRNCWSRTWLQRLLLGHPFSLGSPWRKSMLVTFGNISIFIAYISFCVGLKVLLNIVSSEMRFSHLWFQTNKCMWSLCNTHGGYTARDPRLHREVLTHSQLPNEIRGLLLEEGPWALTLRHPPGLSQKSAALSCTGEKKSQRFLQPIVKWLHGNDAEAKKSMLSVLGNLARCSLYIQGIIWMASVSH